MYVYWVTSLKSTGLQPMLFATREKAERDAQEQNEMRGEEVFYVVELEVF
jgi:hypothetical protein